MIKGRCHTNLDGYGAVKWPEEFVAVPGLGERVQARSGVSLKVVGITHTTIDIRDDNDWSCIIGSEPCIRVELNR